MALMPHITHPPVITSNLSLLTPLQLSAAVFFCSLRRPYPRVFAFALPLLGIVPAPRQISTLIFPAAFPVFAEYHILCEDFPHYLI